MQEHLHTRGKAGLFDVSHMGQVILRGSSYEATAKALEKLIPMDVLGLPVGRQRYGLLTNEEGGLRDDLMFANRERSSVCMVVNAANKEADIAYMRPAIWACGLGLNLRSHTHRPRAAGVAGTSVVGWRFWPRMAPRGRRSMRFYGRSRTLTLGRRGMLLYPGPDIPARTGSKFPFPTISAVHDLANALCWSIRRG